MNIKNHLPNFLTCCNLLCGCLGIIETFRGHLTAAAYLIFIACVFDFFDGFAARALKANSPIGKDLDSLADMVTFGVLPGFIIFQIFSVFFRFPPFEVWTLPLPEVFGPAWRVGSLTALLIPVFSALRLAKFNNDTRQSDRFMGLPTPANALFISSLGILIEKKEWSGWMYDFFSPVVIIPLTLLLCYLLVAELPLIALKFKNYSWPDNKMRYILIISSVILLLTLNFTAIPIIIILYIILSIIENKFVSAKNNAPGSK